MDVKYCDICGKEEDWGNNFFLSGFGKHPPEGIKEVCPECRRMLIRVIKKLEHYFKELQAEMLKELAVRMKQQLTKAKHVF